MTKDITITEALQLNDACFVDVRSEGEFEEGSIPGAINIPVFDNEERAKVGTTYKQVGTEEAKRIGLEISGPKLPALFDKISNLTKEKKVILYCWRGGMRSKYTAKILNSLGLRVYRVQGGYKAYRRYVHSYLNRDIIPHKSIVIHGLTGVGKTVILQKLQELGFPVLDLEGIARHRGSVFGKIGLPASPSQKDFESQVVQVLVKAESKGVVLVECESRRVGKLIVPSAVINTMTKGHRILVYASLQNRVERIINEYTNAPDNNIQRLQFSITLLKKTLGNKVVEELNNKISEKKFSEVIPYLLTYYYDPLYKYPDRPSNEYDLSVDCDDLESATNIIAKWVKALPEYGVSVENGGEGHANRGSLKECTVGEGLFF